MIFKDGKDKSKLHMTGLYAQFFLKLYENMNFGS